MQTIDDFYPLVRKTLFMAIRILIYIINRSVEDDLLANQFDDTIFQFSIDAINFDFVKIKTMYFTPHMPVGSHHFRFGKNSFLRKGCYG